MARFAVRTKRPQGLTGVNRAVSNRLGLTALYLLADRSAWRINQVTGAVGGVVAGAGVTWVDGLMRTPGTSEDGVRLATGIASATAPVAVLFGMRGISGSVSWSWLDETSFIWTGRYGEVDGSVKTTVANSFDGVVALTGGTLTNGVYRYAASHDSATSLRGRVFGGSLVSDGSATVPTVPNGIALGWANRSGAGAPAVADFEFFAVFNRALSESDQDSLVANPWQLFAPIRKGSRAFTVASGVTIDASTGAAVGAGLSATVASSITIAANVGAATAAGLGATVSSAQTVAGSVGAAVGAGLPAGVASSITIAAAVGAATASGLSATVSAGATVSASVGSATAAGQPAGVESPITVAASAGAAVASGLSAGISTGNSVAASTGAAVAAGLAAGVSSPITVAASVGAASAAGPQASVATGATVQAGTAAAIALGLQSNVSSTYIIAAGIGAAHAAGLQASVTVGDEIEASVGAATAAGLAATIANPTVALTAATGTRGGYGVQMQLAARRAQIQTGRRRN